jgi:oxygen-independent coproporphyrinogen-3 oxidase
MIAAPMDLAASLARRMASPQRHRLLQGYPAVPLMQRAAPYEGGRRRFDGALVDMPEPEPSYVTIDRSRTLIVGVIPHTMCTPKVRGCGFCTFGQDHYRGPDMRLAMHDLHDELAQVLPEFEGREVAALYFGGGTANLTPLRELERAFETLAARLDLRGAELTLEGVPSLFLSRFAAPLRWLAKLPVARTRISMGVQTFDPDWQRRMGREHFGDARLIGKVAHEARKRGIGCSADLLINLPGQTLAQMLADIARALELGLDQICIYHLVLYEGLGTPWSKDPALLAARPSNAAALEHWLAVREALLAAGYVQTTLTNFERADVHASARAFAYEHLSFSPERVDGLGIGPLALSTFVEPARRRAIKLLRGRSTGRHAFMSDDFWFAYAPEDVSLLLLTRSLARMRWAAASHHALLGTDIAALHGEAIAACEAAGLLVRRGEDFELTPSGMFYADAIAGTLAEPRVEQLRALGSGVHTSALVVRRYLHMG